MMKNTISISPLTRIEGHLAVHAKTEATANSINKKEAKVTEAFCEGELFRGFETIMKGRDPLDAQQITQRICGVCPTPHGIASIQAQEMAYGLTPSRNGRILQNLILAANYLHSHILHFYHLSALDFVDVKAVLEYKGKDRLLVSLKQWIEESLARKDVFPAAPFLPRYEVPYISSQDVNVSLVAHYVQALDVRRVADEMAAVFAGRVPHSTALVPGGVTQTPTLERILSYRARLKKVMEFAESVFVPDLLEVAKVFPQYFDFGRGRNNFLSFGVFPSDSSGGKFIKSGAVIDGKWEPLDQEQILEEVGYSRFSQSPGRHPKDGQTIPETGKNNAYSWIKAPRYRGQPMEVGALARVMVNYLDPSEPWIKKEVDAFLTGAKVPAEKLNSVLGRHVARGLETLWVGKQADKWLDELEIDGPPTCNFTIPKTGSGYGLTEAPRGALGHWLSIDNHVIKNYQCVVPTTWNCSPRDDKGQPGPIEHALVGTIVEDPDQPMEVARIVRSFDPCIACAVH
jgi:ferredoxin hydrogenase large subunit/hydrogenase large subunit